MRDEAMVCVKAQSKRRDDEPQSEREMKPFDALLIAGEAEVGRERERQAADRRIRGRGEPQSGCA
jgi:hypothetical protein